jgi:hypothetical protein
VYWSDAAQAWRSDARVFRTAFNLGFVAAIGARLQQAREAALAQDREREAATAGGVQGEGRGALVLAAKADEVAGYYAEASQARGTWRGGRLGSVAFSHAGHRSGEAAGRSARLSAPEGLGGSRGELA